MFGRCLRPTMMAGVRLRRLKSEIEPRVMLEKQAALHSIALATDNNNGGRESQDLEFLPQLIRVPDLAVLRFQICPAALDGVDCSGHCSADSLGVVVHVGVPVVDGCGFYV